MSTKEKYFSGYVTITKTMGTLPIGRYYVCTYNADGGDILYGINEGGQGTAVPLRIITKTAMRKAYECGYVDKTDLVADTREVHPMTVSHVTGGYADLILSSELGLDA